MNYFVVNAHWDNRGDEAAIRSMMMELLKLSDDNTVSIQRAIGEFGYFPQNEKIMVVPEFPKSGKKGVLEYYLALLTNGRIVFSKEAKAFYKALKKCNVVLHAPGGPSIGDIYIFQETNKLRRLKLVLRAKKKLMFYAPSMGPFNNKERNKIRKSILNQCDVIVLREAVSKEYLKKLDLNKEAIVTLDSAFQYQFSTEEYKRQFEEYFNLKRFLEKYDGKVIGITVTDLMWNSKYKATGIDKTIRTTFEAFVQRLIADNWGIVFIPQLFGNNGDYDYMAYVMEAADYTLYITGSAQPKLSQANLNCVKLPIPPMEEQKAIVAYLWKRTNKIDTAINKTNKMISLLQERKQIIINEVVTGKVKVT